MSCPKVNWLSAALLERISLCQVKIVRYLLLSLWWKENGFLKLKQIAETLVMSCPITQRILTNLIVFSLIYFPQGLLETQNHHFYTVTWVFHKLLSNTLWIFKNNCEGLSEHFSYILYCNENTNNIIVPLWNFLFLYNLFFSPFDTSVSTIPPDPFSK